MYPAEGRLPYLWPKVTVMGSTVSPPLELNVTL